MQLQLLFLAIAPLVVFWVALQFRSEAEAVGLAIGTSALELVYNSVALGFLEPFSLVSFTTFLVFGMLAIARGKLAYFAFQSVVLEFAVALVFLYARFELDVRLVAVILDAYVEIDTIVAPYQRGYVDVYARTLSTSLPFLLLLHAGLLARFAVNRSVTTWVVFRVFGLYAMVGVLFVVERLLRVTY